MVRVTVPGEVRLAYNEARKTYKKLPPYDAINNSFEIIRIEYSENVIPEVRRLILHYFQLFSADMQAIISPHPQDPHSMTETAAFSKEDKQKVYKLYKKLWYWIHQGILTSVEGEKEQAELICALWKAWPDLKKEYKRIMTKVVKEWQKDVTKQKEDKGYLG